MNDLTLNLLVLVVLALLGGLVFFLVRRTKAENEQKIIRLALKNGWQYASIREPLAWGLRLTSARWTLEAISRSSGGETAPGSSDVAMSTTWQAPNPGSTLLIGERTSSASPGGMGERLTLQVLRLALGADANGVVEVSAGSDAFRQKYSIWAQKPADLQLTPAIESALLDRKGEKPLIKRTSAGLFLELRGVRLQKADEILIFVQLGEALIAA